MTTRTRQNHSTSITPIMGLEFLARLMQRFCDARLERAMYRIAPSHKM